MTALQWMQKEAKKIQKQHPRMKWMDIMKKSGAAYRSSHKKVSGAKKIAGKKAGRKVGRKVGAYKVIERGEKRSTRPKAVYKNVRSNTGTFKSVRKIGSLTSHMSAARKILLEQIGKLEGMWFMAGTQTEKKRIRKMILEKRKMLRKVMMT